VYDPQFPHIYHIYAQRNPEVNSKVHKYRFDAKNRSINVGGLWFKMSIKACKRIKAFCDELLGQ